MRSELEKSDSGVPGEKSVVRADFQAKKIYIPLDPRNRNSVVLLSGSSQ